MKYFITILFILTLSIACNNNNQQEPNNDIATTQQTNSNNEIVNNAQAKSKIDCLEKLFNNENYLFINKGDSSYLYFTRLNTNTIFTHTYKMQKGDSVNVKVDTIFINPNNTIEWSWQGKKLLLDTVSNITSKWMNGNDSNSFIQFNKLNSSTINVKNSKADISYLLNKTINISLFLVRSKYDYKNRTHYAFDTTNFTKKH